MCSSNANNCLNSDIWLEKESQKEYGCHKAQFNNNLREKICVCCHQRKPTSLEELAFSVILENTELLHRFDTVLGHLPHRICWLIGRALNANLIPQAWQLVGFVSEYRETRPSWFDVDQSKTVFLARFRLYCEVYQKLKPYMTSHSAGIDEILQYLSNFASTYYDFWSKMTSAITKLKAETDSEDPESLKSIICAGENNVVLVNVSELTQIVLCISEYEPMKELQRLNKIFAGPVAFKPTAIGHLNMKSHETSHLLDDIDPEVIVEVDIVKTPWSVTDIYELGRVLSKCTNLSSIYLRQHSTNDDVLENVAPAVSKMLSQHHQVQKIGLQGFDLAGTLAMYPLPPVETLQFFLCSFTEEDLDFMANKSDLALKTLVVRGYFDRGQFPSLSIFIQNQAKSLETLRLEFITVSPVEISKLLRNMAKFNKLQTLVLNFMEEIDFVSIEGIIVDLMSIHSTRRFYIYNPTTSDDSETVAAINHLDDVMEKLCKVNRRPPIDLDVITPMFFRNFTTDW